MADTILSSEVRGVLSRATTSGNVLVLPEGQLDRKLYEAVNKALTNAGGKWKRGTGHVFASDAAPKLSAMLGTGVAVDEKKRDQSFFTPRELALRVATLAEVAGYDVLEPSAGLGALALACMDSGANEVECFEINREHADKLLAAEWPTTVGDFLRFQASRRYARIVMNPPFTKNQDIKHVRHALTWLAPRGILTAIMLDNQTRKDFQEIVAKYDPEIIEVERGAFKESGTMIPTIIVKIVKA
jgi:predicted RNA methylase